MSFYLTLTSDGSKGTFPANHGGDFKVQLDQTLDMRSQPWEVALVDMLYTGQAFPNLPTDDSQVTLKAGGKPKFENDYFITYDQTLDLWLKFWLERRSPDSTLGRILLKHASFYLPRQHYSWPAFVDTLKFLCYQKFNMAQVNLSETEFQFSETNEGLDNIFSMKMSKDFSDLFGIDLNYKQDFHLGRVHLKLPITKIPKPADDTSMVFYYPFAANKSCKIEVGGELIFKLTPQYWTVNMFKRAINALSEDVDSDISVSTMTIEEGSSPEDYTLVLTADKEMKGSVAVKISSDFMTVFHTATTDYNLTSTEPLKIPLAIIRAEDEDIPWKNYEASKRLQNNYYPTITSLIKELNDVLADLKLDIAKQRKSSTKGFKFFSVSDDVVKFAGKDGFAVLLSTGLLRLLRLPISWLTTSTTGTGAVVIQSYKRSHLYVHLDCLDYHYINNNVSDLIKVVPNNAALGEKVQLTFSNPHYYAVVRRYMANINMFITDSYFDGILHFDRDIAYTLHFRKCLHSS